MTLNQKNTFLIVIMLLSGFVCYGQQTMITGVVKDRDNQFLIGAAVAILNTVDSALITGGSVDSNGAFKIERLNAGNYLVKVSFLGYQELYKSVTMGEQPIALGDIILKEKAQKLGEVLVEGKIPPAQQYGDTTQYNANAFKTNPDASAEDLLTKMPGVTTQDGKVQAQGEDVKTVLVDGKPFFGDDPATVLKNIPAEIIDKIQIFDRKSDQALFTGFDDGNTSKTINIVTKTQFRNGTFGKVLAGYGSEDRYKSGTTINFFKGKRRFTLLAQSNNINEQNFSMEDLAGVVSSPGNNNRPGGQGGNPGGGGFRGQGSGPSGGGGRQFGGQGNDVGTFLVNQNSGINTTHAFGFNYTNQFKKLDLTASYFYNYTGNKATSELFRQYSVTKNEGLSYTENKTTKSNNINHRVSVKLEYKIDSLRSVVVQPRFTAQVNSGSTEMVGQNSVTPVVLSTSANAASSQLKVFNFSAPILFRSAFHKKGRTFSLNLTPGYNSYMGESYLISYPDSFHDSLNADSLNQFAILDKKGIVFNSNVTFTEPLSEKILLNLTYISNYNETNSDKETFDLPDSTETKPIQNILLSNQYRYVYFSQSLGAGLRYQKEAVNFSLGAAYQLAQVKKEQTIPDNVHSGANYKSILPNAMLMIKFSEKKNLRINYRTSNTPPAINQLQNVINNSNPLQVTIGNPDLKQDWQHNLNLRYSAINSAKNTSLFFLLNLSYTNNYIGNSTTIATIPGTVINNYELEQGAQLTKPVNFNDQYSLRAFLNYSFALTKIKSNLNVYAGTGYSKTPGITNDLVSFTTSTTPNIGMALTSNISKNVDFTISSNTSIAFSDNTLQTSLNAQYLNQSTRFKLNVLPWKGLVIQSDLTHQYYTGLSENYNEKYLLWNAGLGYKFLKKEVAEIRFSVYDILDQNKSITRNFTESYYEDVKSNVLQQYFMLTFTYNLKFYKETTFNK